jgi:sterol desaturase/sphingolipid hydroxylase (fatty acid hydroxylase superfamily)
MVESGNGSILTRTVPITCRSAGSTPVLTTKLKIKVMEIMFAVSWIIGLILCSVITFIGWNTNNKEMLISMGYMWVVMIVFGWVLGISALMAAIYVALVPEEN